MSHTCQPPKEYSRTVGTPPWTCFCGRKYRWVPSIELDRDYWGWVQIADENEWLADLTRMPISGKVPS